MTKDNDTYIRQLEWSPDSKTILYTDRKNRIVVVDVSSKAKKVLKQNLGMCLFLPTASGLHTQNLLRMICR